MERATHLVSEVFSFVMVKPDAISRGLTETVAELWRACGYGVTDVGWRRLSRLDVFRLGHLDRRVSAPIKDEFTAQYLTSGPVKMLSVTGCDVISASGAIKNLFRQSHDADELHSLIHSPASPEELEHQRWILLGEAAQNDESNRELTDLETERGCGLKQIELRDVVARTRSALLRTPRRSWTVPAAIEADSEEWGLVVSDDTMNSVDMIAGAIRAELPCLPPTRVVEAAIQIKTRSGEPLCFASGPTVGRLWDALGRHGLNSDVVTNDQMTKRHISRQDPESRAIY
jgi:nucleoside diphosphate kinase